MWPATSAPFLVLYNLDPDLKMDEETLKIETLEYVGVSHRWKKLVTEGKQMSAALRAMADGLKLPENEKGLPQLPDIARDLIANVPDAPKMQRLIEDIYQTFRQK